jgi:hypothetical protein
MVSFSDYTNWPIHPRPKGLILPPILQTDTIPDEHTRRVGSQELGRATLWECPTARSASHETRGQSGHQAGRESPGVFACSHAHLERKQGLVSFAGRARWHLCGVDTTASAPDERTSHVRSRGCVGARPDRYRSVASSHNQWRGTHRQRPQTP